MRLDPRAKLIIVMLLTSIAIFKEDSLSLIVTLVLTIILSIIVQSKIKRRLMVMKRLLFTFMGIFLLQCVFNRGGDSLISIGEYILIYEQGFLMGTHFVLRMVIIILCGGILATSNSREMIQGLVQLKTPYELAFMVTIAIGFIPLLGEELKNTLVALSLRGINIKELPLKARVKAISALFMPVIINTLERSKELSISLDLRGFRLHNTRTSYYTLTMEWQDYIGIICMLIITVLIYSII